MTTPTADDAAWYKAPVVKISESELRLLDEHRTPGDRAIKDRQAEWLRAPRVTAVDDGAFGMPDMFLQNESQEETMKDDTFTLEVTTYPGDKQTLLKVEDARIQEGFLRIVQNDGKLVTMFNVSDVCKTVTSPEDA